jgi:pimeloyl-ACP methyl ester carboxylesterase
LFCPPAKGTSHLPVIALRGTDNVDDWVTNVLMIKVKCELCALKHGWVHAGFYARAQELLLLIEYVLAQWPCLQPAKGLVLAGHSLGGAVSTLLTAIWPHKNVPIKRLVTFGAPAVGDKVFQQALEGAVPQQVHYTLLGDFVPEVLGVMELVRAVYEGVLSPKRPTFVTSPYQISLFPTQCALAHVDRIAAAAVWELSHLRGFIPHEMLCYIGALEEMESVQRYLDGLEDL